MNVINRDKLRRIFRDLAEIRDGTSQLELDTIVLCQDILLRMSDRNRPITSYDVRYFGVAITNVADEEVSRQAEADELKAALAELNQQEDTD